MGIDNVGQCCTLGKRSDEGLVAATWLSRRIPLGEHVCACVWLCVCVVFVCVCHSGKWEPLVAE